MRNLLVAGITPIFLFGCGSGAPVGAVAATRDSAGIRIVENADPVAVAAELTPEPTLVLGEIGGTSEELFADVVGAVRTASGRISVADRPAKAIHVFDSSGAFVRDVGRPGEGPGDFKFLAGVWPSTGDTVVAWDVIASRLTAFDSAGAVAWLRAIPQFPVIERPDGIRSRTTLTVLGLLRDGRLLARSSDSRTDVETTAYSDSFRVWVVDSSEARFVARVFSREWWAYVSPGRVTFGLLPYARTGLVVPTGDDWIHSDGNRHQVVRYRDDGSSSAAYRVHRPLRPVDEAAKSRFAARRLDGEAGGDDARIDEILGWLTYPDSMPAYDQLAVDELDHVWARVFPDTASTASWDLFSPDGTLLGTVAVPADLTVRQIGADWLLATRKGELDEPLVVLYRLTRHR